MLMAFGLHSPQTSLTVPDRIECSQDSSRIHKLMAHNPETSLRVALFLFIVMVKMNM